MIKRLNEFVKLEAFGSIVLFFSAILALGFSNSAFNTTYENFFNAHLTITFNDIGLSKPLVLWINEGLMAIFFCLVVLELRHEFTKGDLANKSSILLPSIAALGGMIVPALIYLYFVKGTAATIGWAIPTATDIAFSLGVLSLFGNRVPFQLKLLLTATAIFDDLAGILIIAVYYTAQISWLMLLGSSVCCVLLFAAKKLNFKSVGLYWVLGFALWVCVLKSGVHATLAGVVLALSLPMDKANNLATSTMDKLHPWVVYFVIPIFALANAGVNLMQADFDILNNPISLGITLGLVIGKPIGILLAIWIAEKLHFVKRPKGLSWNAILAMAFLCGIGFTMSLFFGILSFSNSIVEYNMVKVGVFVGSLISGVIGSIILKYSKL